MDSSKARRPRSRAVPTLRGMEAPMRSTCAGPKGNRLPQRRARRERDDMKLALCLDVKTQRELPTLGKRGRRWWGPVVGPSMIREMKPIPSKSWSAPFLFRARRALRAPKHSCFGPAGPFGPGARPFVDPFGASSGSKQALSERAQNDRCVYPRWYFGHNQFRSELFPGSSGERPRYN